MSFTMVRIDDFRHKKMKDLSGNSRGAVVNEYRKAIDFYISYRTQENMVMDTRLESYINERINKLDKHLSAMLARTGMDTSMNLMAMTMFLEKFFNGKYTREQLQEQLRRDGARYFSNVINKDREEKK